jgi:hypothetical protein
MFRIPGSGFEFQVPSSGSQVPCFVPGFRFRFPGSDFQVPVFGRRIHTVTFRAPDNYPSRTRLGNENAYMGTSPIRKRPLP